MNVCPACSAKGLVADFATSLIAVYRCAGCGHRTARHFSTTPAADYHDQYEQGGFVDALSATRARQARQILARIRATVPGAKRLLDFGCGRGWFLDAARAAGWEVAGADTSAKAVDLLHQRGISAFLVGADDCRRLPVAADVLTLLDIIEHFPPDELLERLKSLVSVELQLVVIKVPTSSGLFYRMATAMRKSGAPTMLERLYQAGTWPPHYHYFSHRSLGALVARAGLRLIEAHRDRDFEPSVLAKRVGMRLPRPLVYLGGVGVAVAASALHMEDSLIFLATPDHDSQGLRTADLEKA